MSIVKVNIDKGYGGGGLTELFLGIARWGSANYDCMERPVLIMNEDRPQSPSFRYGVKGGTD